jgi:hypothetical protein
MYPAAKPHSCQTARDLFFAGAVRKKGYSFFIASQPLRYVVFGKAQSACDVGLASRKSIPSSKDWLLAARLHADKRQSHVLSSRNLFRFDERNK